VDGQDWREIDVAFKILVADDHIDDRIDEIYELPALLRAAGYEVVTTADGEAAYDLVWEHLQEKKHELRPTEKRMER
jgi:CheY-like chemotaxis protein